MQGQLTEIIKQYPELKKSADAATDSVNLARKSAHLEERAWIIEITDTVPLADGKPISVPIQFKNTGKTPAKKFQGHVVVTVLDAGQEPWFDYTSKTVPRTFMEIGTIFPNAPLDLSFKAGKRQGGEKKVIDVTPSIREQITRGDLYILVYGNITYDDIFGASHWMKFCQFNGGHLDISTPKTYKKCSDYNDTDNNE